MRLQRNLIGLALAGLALGTTPAMAADAGRAYVSNQEGGVTVIDLRDMKVVGEVAGVKSPRGIGITADGKTLVTANRTGGELAIIDTATLKVVKRVPIGKNPEFVRVRGDRAFVSYEPSAKGGPPSKDGKDDDDDKEPKEPARVAIVDLKAGKVVSSITSGPETEGIEFAPDGKSLLVTNEADNTVTSHDIASGKLLKTVETAKIGDRPRGVKVSPDGKQYAVTLEFGDKLMILDQDMNVVKSVATGKSPYGVAYDREGKRLFVASSKSRVLQVFDAKTLAVLQEIPVGERCWHFSFTPDDAQILLACGRSNEVQVIDAKTYKVTASIPDKKLPWGVVTYPKAMGSLDVP